MAFKPNYDETIPCINCITFAACKSQIGEALYSNIYMKLLPKCSLIQEYIYSEINLLCKDDVLESQSKVEDIKSYFHHYGEENGTM
jgi:hypothetical protein